MAAIRTTEELLTSLVKRVKLLERRLSRRAGASGVTGAVTAFAGAVAPPGYLLCNGAAVSRAEHAALFDLIGTTYGAGDGATTFNVPNLLGRVPVGRDAAQTEFDVLGETGGAKTHTLTTAQIPAHAHTQRFASNAIAPGGGAAVGGMTAAGGVGMTAAQQTTVDAGGGGAHNNLQPYIALNYIIKT